MIQLFSVKFGLQTIVIHLHDEADIKQHGLKQLVDSVKKTYDWLYQGEDTHNVCIKILMRSEFVAPKKEAKT